MSVFSDILAQIPTAKPESDGWFAGLCVCHEADGTGHKPSLRVHPADIDDGALVCCMGGCGGDELAAAFGLGDEVKVKASKSDTHTFLFYRPSQNGGSRQVAAIYDYTDEAGMLLYQKVRYTPKGFVQRRPDGAGGWIYSLTKDGQGKRLARPIRHVPYRLSELLRAAEAGAIIFANEGEKATDAIRGLGLPATCADGGAGRWPDELSGHFKGARGVIVCVDNDGDGRKHGGLVSASLRKQGIPCATLEIPGLPEKGDAYDAVQAGMTKDDLLNMAEHALEGAGSQTATAPATTQPLPIFTVADLMKMDIPQPEFVVGPPFALARGTVAELDAYPKHGKTRLTLDAIWSIRHGLPFLDASTEKVDVLYLTEEWLITWREALREAHLLGDENTGLHWMSLIELRGRQDGDWSQLCETIRGYCLAHGIGLLVVDTLARWAGVADENDAVAMAAAVLPLRLIAAENVAVLFLRHDRKGGGQLGESGRGSSATTGEADQILHLQRKAGQGEATLRQRELEGIGRLTGMTGKLIVELNDRGHFDLLGDKADVALQRARDHILCVLPSRKDEAWMLKEVAERFLGSESTLNRAIRELCRSGEISGQKGVGHAAESRGARAMAYWRLLPSQEGFDLDDD